MARITTKESLIAYIRLQLGEPMVQVQVVDPSISQIIDDTVQRFTEFAYGDLEGVAMIELGDAGEYLLPSLITNISKLNVGGLNGLNFSANFGTAFVPDMWSENFFTSTNGGISGSLIPSMMKISSTQSIIDKFMGNDVNYNFNPFKKVLQLMENVNETCLLNYKYEYTADDDGDYIFDNEWIKRYCCAKVKFLWGSAVGLYDQALVGNARINYADLKNEAVAEMAILDEELINKWCDPAPIMIG